MLVDKVVLYTWNRKDCAYESLEVAKCIKTETRITVSQGGEPVEYLIHYFQLENGSIISVDEIDYEIGGWMVYDGFVKIVEDHKKSLKWVLYVEKRLVVDKDYKIHGRTPAWSK